jgi:glycosyltransferase involved in cell wall biosynthesis
VAFQVVDSLEGDSAPGRLVGGRSPAAVNTAPAVSLIVCTRNRASRLAACLHHITRLEPPAGGWELVVVDNASTDDTPRLIDELARAATFPVRHVREPRPGLGRARNAGIARAGGDIYAFTDDDCYVRPDFLWQVCRVFEQETLGWAGGRIVLYDPTDDPATTKDQPHAELIAPYTFVAVGTIHGANMAMRRQVITAIGAFDPALGAGAPLRSGEDLDLVSRASWAGWPGTYDPRPVVAHHHGRKPGKQVQALKSAYDHGIGACFAKALLDPDRRALYLRRWLWIMRYRIRRGMLGPIRREMAGAAHYLAYRLLHRAGSSHI